MRTAVQRRTACTKRRSIVVGWLALVILANMIGLGNVTAAVILVPDESPTIPELEPDPYPVLIGPPLEEGEPVDMAHWARLLYPGLNLEEALERARDQAGDRNVESVVVRDPRQRPALYATFSDLHPSERIPKQWFQQLSARRGEVAATARSIGRLEVRNLQTGSLRFFLGFSAGTAFVAAPQVLMTNRHVAELFADGKVFKKNRETREEAEVWVNFGATLGQIRSEGHRHRVTEILYVGDEDNHDVALLEFEVADDSIGPPPIPLQVETPQHEIRLRQVIVGGYPFDEASFFRSPAVKRIAPGVLKEVFRGDPDHPVLYHDCSTAKGNSGSPVVDLQTGRVYGVHFSGDIENHAEVMWEVLKNTEIRDVLGIEEVADLPEVEPVSIIVPRPALLIDQSGRVDPAEADFTRRVFGDVPIDWEVLAERAQGVGQIRIIKGGEPGMRGTGFMMAPGLLMTAAFVVEEFLGPTELLAQVSFNLTFDATESRRWFDLTEPDFFEEEGSPFAGLALLRVAASGDELPVPLPVDLSVGRLPRNRIAVIGFHHVEAEAVRWGNLPALLYPIFEGPEGVKRLSPGLLIESERMPRHYELAHDASTAMGSGGAPILDLLTGEVIGVHLGGQFQEYNRGLGLAGFSVTNSDFRNRLTVLLDDG